jgi:FkbM family methyltransferase
MNYFITHSDRNYLKYAERLFESLQDKTNTLIIYYTVDFHYQSKYKNVIPVYFSTKDYISSSSYKKLDVKSCLVFLKPIIAELSLKNYAKSVNDSFCYIDCDCLAKKELDSIFNHAQNITNYPLLNRACFEYMLLNGRGDPFMYGYFNLNNCLEAELLKALNIDLNLRTSTYAQTGVFVFNSKCSDFITEWKNTCFLDFIFNDQVKYAPFHEETVINCLLWKNKYFNNLSQVLINIPYESNEASSLANIKRMNQALDNVSDNGYLLSVFCYIPSKKDINNLYFYHGKISDSEYNLFKEMNHRLLLKIYSPSLGDTLACTPTLRKLYNSYGKKLTVVTHHKELFKNNIYVENCFDFSEFENITISFKEVFETFLGVGRKNNLGIEKKHNTIDIRQFHAIDLGFMLSEKEMEYDFIADPYQNIDNLPNQYVCLHVSTTWPSRTYSSENWQKIIDSLNSNGVSVVLIGKDSSEQGFYNINKQVQNLRLSKGIDLTNKLSLSQAWHVINKSSYFITMDSGLLHLAGTTDAFIIQLGSSINNKLRAPFRYGSQDYKYNYVSGSCGIFCASNIKYGVKEWNTIQGVPPLINCLENKSSFECHPNPSDVLKLIKLGNSSEIDSNYIKVSSFNKDQCIIHYSLAKSIDLPLKIKIIDTRNGFIIYREVLNNINININFWTSFIFAKQYIHQNVYIIFELGDEIVYRKVFTVHDEPNFNTFSNYEFNGDVDFFSYLEIFGKNLYKNQDIEIQENDIVVDIGSNVGAFIKYANDKKAKKIYSCEPNPNCINIIDKYYGINKNVVLNQFAISDRDGETFLQIDCNSITSGCSKILESKANGADHYKNATLLSVKTISFKNFIKANNIDFIDFLKIDCEGGEVFIFIDENKEFFMKNVKKIVLEFHNEKKIDIINFLKSANYEVYSDDFNNSIGMMYAKNKLFN